MRHRRSAHPGHRHAATPQMQVGVLAGMLLLIMLAERSFDQRLILPDVAAVSAMLNRAAIRFVVRDPAILMVQRHATMGVVMDFGAVQHFDMRDVVAMGMGFDSRSAAVLASAFDPAAVGMAHAAAGIMVRNLAINAMVRETAMGVVMRDAAVLVVLDLDDLVAVRVNVAALAVEFAFRRALMAAVVMALVALDAGRLRLVRGVALTAGVVVALAGAVSAPCKAEIAGEMRSPKVFAVLQVRNSHCLILISCGGGPDHRR